jgi:hypothetical protein
MATGPIPIRSSLPNVVVGIHTQPLLNRFATLSLSFLRPILLSQVGYSLVVGGTGTATLPRLPPSLDVGGALPLLESLVELAGLRAHSSSP